METTNVLLPMKVIKADIKSPKDLIIFSKPKAGKTTLLSKLPNCLILDFEEGSDYVDALKVKIIGITTPKNEDPKAFIDRKADNKWYLIEIGNAIRAAGNPYKYIAIDTATALEDMCVGYAEELYSKSPMGKNWFQPEGGRSKYGNILNMPDGAGYKWLRDAFEKVLAFINPLAERIIISGHIKDVQLEKNGTDFTSADLDLTGKIKRITASKSDAIGYLYRKGKKTILSFKSSDEVACGARPDHLRGQEIVIAEEIDDKLVTYWDRIYIDSL